MVIKLNYVLTRVFSIAFFFPVTPIFSQSIVTVTNTDLHGWKKDEQLPGKICFAKGPSKPPLGKGSLEFDAPAKGHGHQIRMRNDQYGGVLLSSITDLTYSAFVETSGSIKDVPLLVLLVDIDGDGKPDGDGNQYTHLSYTPRFQNPMDSTGFPTKFGWYKPGMRTDKNIRWQYPIRHKTWQKWNAFYGGWVIWTVKNNSVDTLPAMFSWSGFIAQYPKARIVNDEGGGGVRLQAGGVPMAGKFVGNADAFTIGINGKITVYDFEMETSKSSLVEKKAVPPVTVRNL